MHPYTVKFGGGVDATILSPIVLAALLVAIVLLFTLPRKYSVAPFLFATFLIPEGQQFYVAGVHLFLLRLLFLAALVFGLISSPAREPRIAGGWTSIDTAFLSYVLITACATLIQFPSMAALINQIGYLWDFIPAYFALRMLIRTESEVVLSVKCLAILTILLAAAMLVEQWKMVNVFGILGGVQLVPELRNGRVRSQGVFQHALTAGAFAASTIPLLLILWRRRSYRLLVVLGMIAGTTMVAATQTSTSYITEAAGLFALSLWPLRRKMKQIRMGIVVTLVVLAVVMKAPIWFLLAHIDLTGGSSGYQRAELINECVNHFSSWWLIGTTKAASWGWDMWDTQNMFVSTAEGGGLAGLIFFILVLSRSFSRIGRARRRCTSPRQEWLVWVLGSAVFANLTAFFGVNYFDQVHVAWFALLSMVCAVTAPLLKKQPLQSISIKVQHTTGSRMLQTSTSLLSSCSNSLDKD